MWTLDTIAVKLPVHEYDDRPATDAAHASVVAPHVRPTVDPENGGSGPLFGLYPVDWQVFSVYPDGVGGLGLSSA